MTAFLSLHFAIIFVFRPISRRYLVIEEYNAISYSIESLIIDLVFEAIIYEYISGVIEEIASILGSLSKQLTNRYDIKLDEFNLAYKNESRLPSKNYYIYTNRHSKKILLQSLKYFLI